MSFIYITFFFLVAGMRDTRVLSLSECLIKFVAAGKFRCKMFDLAVDIASLGTLAYFGTVLSPSRQLRLFHIFLDSFCHMTF